MQRGQCRKGQQECPGARPGEKSTPRISSQLSAGANAPAGSPTLLVVGVTQCLTVILPSSGPSTSSLPLNLL